MRIQNMVRSLIAVGTAPLIVMGAGPAAAEPWYPTPYQVCQAVRNSGGPVSPNLVISDETKEPGFWVLEVPEARRHGARGISA